MAPDGDIALFSGEPAAAEDPDLPGPFTVGRWAKGFQDFLRERPRVLVLGEVFNLKRARTSTYFELRDAEGAARVRDLELGPRAVEAARGRVQGRRRGRDRRRARLLPGQPDRVAELQLPRHLHPARGRGRPARPARAIPPATAMPRGCSSGRALFPAPSCRRRSASSPPATAPPAPTCSPGSSAAAGAGRSSGPTPRCRIAAPPARSAPRCAASPSCRGRGRGRLSRRRQPHRPVGVLRREPLPHDRDAAPAGDQRRRPRGRPDADRRRRRGLLLDPDPRRGGARAARRQPGPQRPALDDADRVAGRARRRSRSRAQRLAECSRAPDPDAARRAPPPAPDPARGAGVRGSAHAPSGAARLAHTHRAAS